MNINFRIVPTGFIWMFRLFDLSRFYNLERSDEINFQAGYIYLKSHDHGKEVAIV